MTRSEECREMLQALLNGIRAHDDPKITIIEDCSPDSARFVLTLAIEAIENKGTYFPITSDARRVSYGTVSDQTD